MEKPKRPPIYGYLRILGDVEDDDAKHLRDELVKYAECDGFELAGVYAENIRNTESAFTALIRALNQGDVKDVIVPSLWHFARFPGLQQAMKQHIEQQTGARVWVAHGQEALPEEPTQQDSP